MEIEVEWRSTASGLTQIDITDLGCKNKTEWRNLSQEEQRKRINIWQIENEPMEFKQIDWYEI